MAMERPPQGKYVPTVPDHAKLQQSSASVASENAGSGTGGRFFLPSAYVLGGLTSILTAVLALQWVHRINNPAHNDFVIFYAAGKLAATGHLAAAYHRHTLFALESRFAGHHHVVQLPFPYPPHMAGFFRLLSVLPLHAGNDVWLALNLAGYALAAIFALQRVDGRWRVAASLALLGCLPLLISSAQGEGSGLLALGFMLTFVGLAPTNTVTASRRGWRCWPVGAGILLLSLKPELLVIPAIILALRRRRDEVTWGLSALAGAALLSITLGGISGCQAFLRQAMTSIKWTTQYNWGPAHTYSLLGQLHGLLGFTGFATVLGVALSLTIIVTVTMLRPESRASWLPIVAGAALIADHLSFHDLTIMYPAAACAFGCRLRWTALAVLTAPWIDPPLYHATRVHVAVLTALSVVVLGLYFERRSRMALTIDGRSTWSTQGGLWKFFGPLRWGSASESGTRSTS